MDKDDTDDVLQAIADLDENLSGKFEGVIDRFEVVDARFEVVEARFGEVATRFDGVIDRFDGVIDRFDVVDARFELVEARFEEVNTRFDRLEGILAYIANKVLSDIELNELGIKPPTFDPSSGGGGSDPTDDRDPG